MWLLILLALSPLLLFLLLAVCNRRLRARRAKVLSSPEHLNRMIAQIHKYAPSIGSFEGAVIIDDIFQCGDGKASTTDRVRVQMEYSTKGGRSLAPPVRGTP